MNETRNSKIESCKRDAESRVATATPGAQNPAPSTQPRIRVFAASDLAAIGAVQAKCPCTAQWREEDYVRLAGEAGGLILVAEREDANSPELTGYAAFYRIGVEAELRNLAVDPAHRRKGIARALLSAGVRTLQEFGVRQLFLEVRDSNQPARALYQSAGFRLLYTRSSYYHDPLEDALVLACDITPASAFATRREL